MKKIAFIFLILSAPVLASGPAVLSNTDHIVSDVVSAVSILGGSNVVNQTCPTPSCFGPGFENNILMIANAVDSTVAQYLPNSSTSTGTPNTNVPYKVLNQSSTGYNLANYDQLAYNALTTNDQIWEMAYCNGPGTGDLYPPVAASTILPNTTGSLATNVCGYAVGIEFSMTAGYKGFATGSPSGTTEAMSGVYAVLRANHPTWTWGDIKGALRQTASNWGTGYTAFNSSGPGYGFGNINYDTANAIASPSSIFLQAPGFMIINHGYYAMLLLYPFVTTRRAKEVIYLGGTWPAASAGNELTAAQIASAGGTKIVDNGGATGAQSFTYAPSVTGSATFTALTLDASGNGSRVETFSSVPASFIVGSACLQ